MRRCLLFLCLILIFQYALRPCCAEAKQDVFSAEVIASVSPAEITPAPTQDLSFHLEIVRPTPAAQGKRILIYHTHTWEAFEPTDADNYIPTEKWRTKDNQHNVVAVGDALTAALTALGFDVTHDDTAFEPPNLDASYSRSLAMLENRQQRGEHYDLYIDLHRDAFASASSVQRTVQIGGESVARFMVLVGRGDGYAVKPDCTANQAIAQRITDNLNEQCTNLARGVKLKTGRFNQHVAPCCVLIECGCNFNTLEEVMNGVPYLAKAIEAALCDD